MSEHHVFSLPHRVTAEIEIEAPIDQVFLYVTDPQNQVHWVQAVSEIRDVSGPPQVGQRYTADAHFLGKRFEQTEEITDYQPNTVYAWQTVKGPVHDVQHYQFEEKTGGTKITVELGVRDLHFLGKLAEPLIVRSARRHQQHSLETLKDLLETHGPEHPR
jgi:uncharacterized membrane protein